MKDMRMFVRPPQKRRNKLDILAAILRSAKGTKKHPYGVRKTHIVYGCNLNFNIVKEYLKELLENGQLILEDGFYFTTALGLATIDNYDALVNGLDLVVPSIQA